MPNITWCDLPEDVSLWPGLPLSLSGDEVMPLDYHAGRSGWLLYGRGLDKQRLTQYQSKLGAAMVIVAAWCVEDYQVIRLAGSLTARATRLAHEAQLDVAPLGKIPHLRTPGLLVMDMDSTAIQIELTQYQSKLGAAMVIVAAWCVEDYQVIRLAGSLTARATRLAHEAQLDVAPLGKIPHLRTPGLLVMDMDSTAIQIECIDEIAKLAGTGERVAEVTERAMRGELDFTASLRSRVATLKGADANILQQVRENLPLMPGLTQLVLKLETLGWKVAIASGGFTFFAEYLRDKLRLTAVVANELEIMDGKFTGNVIGDIVDAQYKAKTLTRLAQEYEIPLAQTVAIGDGANDLPMIKAAGLGIAYHAYEIPLAQTVAIGDGANDLPMIKAAGLGIAYHAKPKVNEKTEVTIRHADLMGVFCILSGSLNQK